MFDVMWKVVLGQKQPQELLAIMRQVSEMGYLFMSHCAPEHTLSAADFIRRLTPAPNRFQASGFVCLGLFCEAPGSVQPSLALREPRHRTLICGGI